jgi:hypothetical protein
MTTIYHFNILHLSFAKFVFSCSLRSHQKTNPTPKNGCRHYLALPTRHPILARSALLTSMENVKMKISAEKEEKVDGKPLHLTRRFGVMAAVAPQKVQCGFGSLPPARSSV